MKDREVVRAFGGEATKFFVVLVCFVVNPRWGSARGNPGERDFTTKHTKDTKWCEPSAAKRQNPSWS
jgi:hypothetical protein